MFPERRCSPTDPRNMSERDPLGVSGETLAQKYEIRELIAAGGFSLVYKGYHKLWKAPIAVKFFTFLAEAPAEDRAALQEAFVNEGALLSELSSQSSSIVQPRDVGTFTTALGDWVPYMVMEWLDGQPLDLILDQETNRREPRRTPAEVYQLLEGVARGLELAHQRGVAHRDVKPENLVVMGDPRAPDVVKLLDFGVAQIMDVQSPALGTTGRQVSAFTPGYGAPEQFDAEYGTTGPWTDVFQLALIATEMLAGRQALAGPETQDFHRASTSTQQRPTPAALGAFVSPELEAVFEQALALYPADRYQSAGSFWAAVADTLGILPTSVRPAAIEAMAARAMTPPETNEQLPKSVRPPPPPPRDLLRSQRAAAQQPSEPAVALVSPGAALPDFNSPSASPSPLGSPQSSPFGSPPSSLFGSAPSSLFEPPRSSPLASPHALGSPPSSRPSSSPTSSGGPVTRPLTPPPRKWLGTGLVALLAAAVAGGGVYYITQGQLQLRAKATLPEPAVDVAAPPAAVALGCPQGMQAIPAGEFFMGSDADAASDAEKPSHHVILHGYCLDTTEVTVAAYQQCSVAGKCRRAATEVSWDEMTRQQARVYSSACNEGSSAREDHPINCVSWSQARDYCEAQGKRLPTEAEWEYAARSSDGRLYPWGDDDPTAKHLNACGWECVNWGTRQGERLPALYEDNDRFPTTAPVGSFPLGDSRFGVKDLVGNVWEWTSDWQGDYAAKEQRDPKGPASGELRVIRGGAWNGGLKAWLRPSFRYAMKPDTVSHGIGFRCAADQPN